MVLKDVVDADIQSFKCISGEPVAFQLPIGGFLFLLLLFEFHTLQLN